MFITQEFNSLRPTSLLDFVEDTLHTFPFYNLKSITNTGKNFPPYNIHQLQDDSFQLDLAVAGYTQDQLKVELEENLLVIRAEPNKEIDSNIKQVVKAGISNCRWVRTFEMLPHTEVLQATLKDGILSIVLALKKKSVRKEIVAIK